MIAEPGGGRHSIDPVVFFRLHLVLFFEELRSERQLMRTLADHLAARWYVGYNSLPDHSSLTKIYTRYGLETFRRFFDAIVERCRGGATQARQDVEADAQDHQTSPAEHLDVAGGGGGGRPHRPRGACVASTVNRTPPRPNPAVSASHKEAHTNGDQIGARLRLTAPALGRRWRVRRDVGRPPARGRHVADGSSGTQNARPRRGWRGAPLSG